MTQSTYFLDTATTGLDTTAAIFNRIMFADLMGDFQGYVVPGYLNNLRVRAGGTSGVYIEPGAAVVKDRVFVSDENVPLSVPAGTGARSDAVVLRYTVADNKVRLALITSEENYYPELTQTDEVWEVFLAYVSIPDGTAINVLDRHLWDRREFIRQPQACTTPPNLFKNGEIIATSVGAVGAPERWSFSGSGAIGSSTTDPYLSTRGRSMAVRDGFAYQDIDITGLDGNVFTMSAGVFTRQWNLTTGNFYFDGTFKVECYTDANVLLETIEQLAGPSRINSSAVNGYAWHDRLTFEVPAGTTWIRAGFYNYNTGFSIYVHYATLCLGYYAPQGHWYHEVIMFDNTVEDTSWDGDSKGAGSTTIDFTSDYGGIIPFGCKVILHVEAWEAASAGTTPLSISVGPHTAATYTAWQRTLSIAGVANGKHRNIQTIVDTYHNSSTPQCTFTVVGTLNVYIRVVGVIT